MISYKIWFSWSFCAILLVLCFSSCFRMNDVSFEVRGFDTESAVSKWEIRKVGKISDTVTVTVRPIVSKPNSASFFALGSGFQYPWFGSENSVLEARLAVQANELRISAGDSSIFVYNLSSPIDDQPALNMSDGKVLQIERAKDYTGINQGAVFLIPIFNSSEESTSFDIFLSLQIEVL